jgi:hypothetical protein
VGLRSSSTLSTGRWPQRFGRRRRELYRRETGTLFPGWMWLEWVLPVRYRRALRRLIRDAPPNRAGATPLIDEECSGDALTKRN